MADQIIKAMDLRIGQRFIWNGRAVTLSCIQNLDFIRFGRKSRQLVVYDSKRKYTLWYQDNENITIVPGTDSLNNGSANA